MKVLVSVVSVITFTAIGVQSHGRMNEPPGRSTAWKFGFDTPINYNDHELFCGGFDVGLNNSELKKHS